MRLVDLFEARFQEIPHHNPSVGTLKALARANKYHSARFVIYKDGSVVAADSEHFTHHSAAPAMGAWALRGYVQYLGDDDYAYRSMEVYSPTSVDHPIFRVWERAGIENGNPDHQRNQISEDSNIDVHNLSIDQLDELMQRNQGKYTFNIPRRALNVANLIRKGAIFVTYPHSKQGWKKDKRDWSYSLITLYNVHGRGWAAQSSQYKKPNSYQGAIQTINHSLPNLGNTDLVYDNKYLQILWSAKKLGLNDREIYLTPELQEAVEKSQNNPQQLYHATLIDNVPSILQAGLTPRVGKIAGGLYKDRAKPLVFATDLQGARRCYCALMSQINMKIGHMPNAEEVAQHGALLIISKDVDKFHQYSAGAKRRKGSIEPGDHYSEEPIRVDQVIKGNDLVKWIKQHQFDQAAGLPLVELDTDTVEENWTKKYKKSINCNNPRGFSQRAHCAARKKRQAGGQTTSKSVSESRMDTLVESMLHNLQSQGLTVAEAVSYIDERLDENLRKWFKQKWVRFGPDGTIRGACARGSEGEGKPKCLPQSKAYALGKKGRATAAARKRRQDPNPEREGKAKNVATTESVGSTKLGDLCTIKTNFPDADFWLVRRGDRKNVGKPTKEFSPYHVGIKVTATEQLMPQYLYYMMMHLHNQGYWQTRGMGTTALLHIRTEDVKNIQLALTEHELKENSSCPHCGGHMVNYSMLSEKQDACYYKVKSRYKVWPSAYASGALVQCRKKGAKNWGNKGKKR